jgi:HAMP domain-containing protein
MTLAKQLWIGLSLMLTLVLLGTLSINLYHAKTYLEEQLYTKNLDNANILSGIIAASDGDDEIKLRIQAYYDLGHYRKITLIGLQGNVVVDMHIQPNEEERNVPAWFMQIFHIVSHPGVATVSKGWKQLGELTIVSHEAQAYRSLWDTVTQMAAWFVLSLILFGGIALYLLSLLTKTLRSVVNQANAIGDRRFILSPVPYTKELKQLVQTMNRMTRRVRRLLAMDAKRIEALRQEAHLDQLISLIL